MPKTCTESKHFETVHVNYFKTVHAKQSLKRPSLSHIDFSKEQFLNFGKQYQKETVRHIKRPFPKVMLRKGEECSDSIAKHSTCISYVSFMVYLTYDACTSCGIYKSNALVAVARTCRNHSSICAMDANILEMFRGHCFHSELL
jgi:hypothetical protein